MKLYPKKIGELIEAYKFRESLFELMNLARLGNKYLAEVEPWKTIKTDIQTTQNCINICLQISALLSVLSEPFMPFSSKKLKSILNFSSDKWNIIDMYLLKEGHQINKPELLFSQIEDIEIEQQIEKLLRTKAENENKIEVVQSKTEIDYADFEKMDIRVGTILSAEKVSKTKKLMKLEVDTGLDKRTIVSGIAEHFTETELVGKQVCVLVNLKARELKGIESNGMILLAESNGRLVFVSPDEVLNNGSEVK
jgi:methionyl-tRNA synthetase